MASYRATFTFTSSSKIYCDLLSLKFEKEIFAAIQLRSTPSLSCPSERFRM
jgi:hypothetical protein